MKKLLCALAVCSLAGCSTLYYSTMEKFGVAKRDIMVDRVKEAQESQKDAKKEFANALEQFRSVVQFKGGSLQDKYDKLNGALQRSESQAAEVRSRIAKVEDVSDALFDEWQAELKQFTNPEFRRSSEKSLRETKARYKTLITAMHTAESRIEPVLQPLREQVLFLKHNLNAQAIGSLTDELTSVEGQVDRLVADMEKAIAEADAFIATMPK
jgi:Skp family chaperone for outer membrane proteins